MPQLRLLFRFFVVVLAMSTVVLTSCEDDEDPIKAEVLVLDSLGVPQAGVDVLLYCTPTPPEVDCVIEDLKRTNSRGISTHEIDLPAVLRIIAIKRDTTLEVTGIPPNLTVTTVVDSLCAEGFIKLEDGDETVRETVFLLECPQ